MTSLVNLTLIYCHGVNSPRLCYVNNEVDSVTPYLTLTYYFEILVICAVILNFVIILKPNS